jgi:hypothetical protein
LRLCQIVPFEVAAEQLREGGRNANPPVRILAAGLEDYYFAPGIAAETLCHHGTG